MNPARFVFIVAFLGASAAVAYGLFIDRTGSQILVAVVGLGILGLLLAALSIWFARVAMRAGRAGSFWRALGLALMGGIVAFGASAALGAAFIFGSLSLSA